MDREDLEFLTDLQNRMNKQDESSKSCDFQASPYFWGVAENKIEWGIDPDYSSDEVCYYYDGEQYDSIEECKELFKDLLDDDNNEQQLKEIENIYNWYDVDNYNDDNDIDGNVVYGRKVEDVISKYTGCFLTKQACKEHIEKYGYNYSEPHTFAMTASRNPEFERVWNILKKTDWKQITDLEAKLAEKDKEIEDAKDVSRRLLRICGHSNCSYKNQTAIAELEKVKEEFKLAFSFSVQQKMFDKYIDQQIKSLKGE